MLVVERFVAKPMVVGIILMLVVMVVMLVVVVVVEVLVENRLFAIFF